MEQHFPVMLFIMLYKVALTFESVVDFFLYLSTLVFKRVIMFLLLFVWFYL